MENPLQLFKDRLVKFIDRRELSTEKEIVHEIEDRVMWVKDLSYDKDTNEKGETRFTFWVSKYHDDCTIQVIVNSKTFSSLR